MKQILIILFLISTLCGHGQRKNIGDKLPPIKFTQLLNASSPSFDFKKSGSKLLLIEFWNSHCGACISAMISLQKLKAKWPKELDVVLLTLEDREGINKFLARRPDLAALQLPMQSIDKTWKEWFPFQSMPTVVWVGKNNTVEAITLGTMVTEQHVGEYLKNGRIILPEKRDLMSFDNKDPLLLPKHHQEVYYSSMFSGPVNGLPNSTGNVDLPGNKMKLFSYNLSLRSMYSDAFRFSDFIEPTNTKYRIIYDIRDTSIFNKDKWGDEKQYCYELVLPKKMPIQQVYELFKKDLNRFFGFRTRIIKKLSNVYWLTSKGGNCNGQKTEYQKSIDEHFFTCLNKHLVANTIKSVLKDGIPVYFTGSGDEKFSFTLKTRYKNLEDLNSDLRKFGLEVLVEQRELEFLLITDSN
jgi:thiol-disulfide isomerase/thioredoxin